MAEGDLIQYFFVMRHVLVFRRPASLHELALLVPFRGSKGERWIPVCWVMPLSLVCCKAYSIGCPRRAIYCHNKCIAKGAPTGEVYSGVA